jgi:hypothetical protein
LSKARERQESALQLGYVFYNLYFEDLQLAEMGAFDGARELDRFSASFAGVLPDLSLAGDDARETYSLASGVVTGGRSRARRGICPGEPRPLMVKRP